MKQNKYITKLQIRNEVSIKESVLGEQLKKIPNYKDYFSPVENTCSISLGKLKNDEIEKCEPIQKIKEQENKKRKNRI